MTTTAEETLKSNLAGIVSPLGYKVHKGKELLPFDTSSLDHYESWPTKFWSTTDNKIIEKPEDESVVERARLMNKVIDSEDIVCTAEELPEIITKGTRVCWGATDEVGQYRVTMVRDKHSSEIQVIKSESIPILYDALSPEEKDYLQALECEYQEAKLNFMTGLKVEQSKVISDMKKDLAISYKTLATTLADFKCDHTSLTSFIKNLEEEFNLEVELQKHG